ncbi:MAG: outer membrane protein assembly factor BamD [Mariprofundales bacterium]|nr:outer membrane protein assembly factor BamD [Mariprofundales bacterium]
MRSRFFLFLTVLLLLGGCASHKPTLSERAEIDYNKAKELVAGDRFSEATIFLDKFSAKHPYSKYVASAALLRVYAAYMDKEIVLSEVLAQRFLDKHPTNADRDYALYMLAMSHYMERDTPERDPTHTAKAIKVFSKLIKEFPKSHYAEDGRGRLQKLSNELAGHELTVAHYYFDHHRLVAAANRLQVIIKKYQTSPQIEEALYLLAACYHGLKLNSDAKQTTQLLTSNYPNSKWSARATDLTGR